MRVALSLLPSLTLTLLPSLVLAARLDSNRSASIPISVPLVPSDSLVAYFVSTCIRTVSDWCEDPTPRNREEEKIYQEKFDRVLPTARHSPDLTTFHYPSVEHTPPPSRPATSHEVARHAAEQAVKDHRRKKTQ